MKEREAYKIVYHRNGKLVSGYAFDTPGERVYRVGRWTPAGVCGPLFVFDTLENARSFCSSSIGRSIYRCVVRKPRRVRWMLFILAATLKELKTFWRMRDRGQYRNKSWTPTGTLVCDAVKLIEEVA